jgi:hypothetical protein
MELLITVVTLVVAVYAIVPRERQLSLTLRLGTFDWFWVLYLLLFAFTIYLSFYQFFEIQGWAPASRNWPTGITPANCIPLLLLLGLGGLWLRIKFSRLSLRHIGKFRDLAQDLLWAGSHAELLALIQDNIKEFSRIYHRGFWHSRLRSRLLARVSPRFETFILAAETGKDVKLLNPFLTRLARSLIRVLPAHEREQQAAAETARGILLAQPFVASLARSRPYLGLTILDLWLSKFEQAEFLDLYMNELLSYRTSAFYAEVANNQNMSFDSRYVLAPGNHLLRFFLADARVAYSMNIYKPVGDFALRELDQLARNPENDSYNRAPDDDFDSRGRWQSPVFAAIRFFDIMVMEALFQGIEWHMWLYYLPHMVERMVRNYKPSDPLVSEEKDWPVKYNFLIYEAFSVLRGWIKAVEHVPASQRNVVLDNTSANLQNDNIPKSSILALSQCVRAVLLSSDLKEKFQDSLANMAFELFFELRHSDKQPAYATVLSSALQSGGGTLASNNQRYRQVLGRSFERNKHEYLITHRQEEDVLELERVVGLSRP